MITAFYSLNRVMGAEYWVAGYFVCVFMYLAICLLFRHSRTKQGLKAVLLNLLLSEIIIDVVWYSMYFPAGEYYNHGITAVYGLFLWPAILIVSGIIVVTFSSPRLNADSELKKKLAVLALVLLAIVATSLLMKNLSPMKARGSSGIVLEKLEGNEKENNGGFDRDDVNFDVRVSFSSPQDSASMINLFEGKGVQFDRLFHEIKTPGSAYSGSFLDCKGRDIQSILRQYNAEVQNSLDRENAYTQQWLGELADSDHQTVDVNDFKELEDMKAKAAYKGYRLDLIDAAAYVRLNGVPIVGARLVANGSTIQKLLEDPRVLTIENMSMLIDNKSSSPLIFMD